MPAETAKPRRWESEPGSDNFTVGFTTASLLARAVRGASGLTVLQMRVLWRVMADGARRTPVELARSLDVGKGSVSSSVRDLREKGLVKELPLAGRGRSFAVLPTLKGRVAFERAHEAAAGVFQDVVSDWPAQERVVLGHLFVVMSSDMGGLVLEDGKIDMVMVCVELSSISKQFFSRSVRKFGLSPNDYRVLNELCNHEEGARPRDLARTLLIKRCEMTGVCNRLEAEGHVEKRPNPADGRSVLVCLTEEGRGFVERVRAAYQKDFTERVRDLEDPEEDLYLAANKTAVSERRRGFRD